MRRARLPGGYAEALESGFWPNMDVMPSGTRAMRGRPLALSDAIIPARVSAAA
jgi:hypothetical protein